MKEHYHYYGTNEAGQTVYILNTKNGEYKVVVHAKEKAICVFASEEYALLREAMQIAEEYYSA